MRKLLLVIPILFCLIACKKKIEPAYLDEMVTGKWSNITYSDSLQVLKKVVSLSLDNYGIAFHQDGGLREIKNSGWCGTPPISFGEFYGTWELASDSLLSIESQYWGGAMTMMWKIIELDNNQMSYYILDTYYEDFK